MYEKIYENVIMQQKLLEENDINLIQSSFSKHFIFYNLSQQALDGLIKEMFYCRQKMGEYIFKQGEQASSYFVIQQGFVDVIINEKIIKTQGPGDSFGELALLYGGVRSATIKAQTDCSFWALDRTKFKHIIYSRICEERDENRKVIDKVEFFKFMTQNQKDAIAEILITSRYLAGDKIVCQGDKADSYFIIKSGQVSIWKNNLELRKMNQYDSFGEQALYQSSTRMATVIADDVVITLSIGRDSLTKILGEKIQVIIFHNIMRWSFNQSKQLCLLTELQNEKLTQNVKIDNYKKGQLILSKGDFCDKLIIVLEGYLIESQSQKIIVTKGQCYGDQYLVKQNKLDKILDNIEVGIDSVLSVINFQQVFQLLGGTYEQVIQKNEIVKLRKIQTTDEGKSDNNIQVEDLIYIKKLGQGQFGSVFLVQHKNDNTRCFALKSIVKSQIIEQNLEKYCLQEKAVLQIVNFPFIMQLVRTFKDNISVYFLIEYIKGLELFDVIREMGLLTPKDTQFYVGSLLLAIEYLHSNNIIYRDIKPENIMINSIGYLILIDLGTAKILKKQNNFHTSTIIGTPHYMAPEVMKSKGYTFFIDLWSIGICAFELICGYLPYGEQSDDPYDIYQEIINTKLTWPRLSVDKESKIFIEQLLSKQPESRLGGSYARLKSHKWFNNFDWDDLLNKEIKPPYIPPVNKIISDKEILKKFEQGKLVVNEIRDEQALEIGKKQLISKIPKWDQDF